MAINVDALMELINDAGIPNDGYTLHDEDTITISYLPEATQQQRDQGDAFIAAHNPALLSRGQTLAAAQDIANQAKLYFLSQLDLVGAPNLTTIFNAVQTTITSNPVMQQRHTRTLAFIAGARGWSLPLNTGSDQGKQRFLEAAFSLIGMMG